jgi:Xaa-Pro aminopeptidase
MAVSARDKLARLRALFPSATPKGIAAYIIPSSDAHQSEYVAACDERRAYVSGFTGSAGTAVVTPTRALLWTDGRYFLQASQQLSEEWTLMKAGLPETPTIEVRRKEFCGRRVGFRPFLARNALTRVISSCRNGYLQTYPLETPWVSTRP